MVIKVPDNQSAQRGNLCSPSQQNRILQRKLNSGSPDRGERGHRWGTLCSTWASQPHLSHVSAWRAPNNCTSHPLPCDSCLLSWDLSIEVIAEHFSAPISHTSFQDFLYSSSTQIQTYWSAQKMTHTYMANWLLKKKSQGNSIRKNDLSGKWGWYNWIYK